MTTKALFRNFCHLMEIDKFQIVWNRSNRAQFKCAYLCRFHWSMTHQIDWVFKLFHDTVASLSWGLFDQNTFINSNSIRWFEFSTRISSFRTINCGSILTTSPLTFLNNGPLIEFLNGGRQIEWNWTEGQFMDSWHTFIPEQHCSDQINTNTLPPHYHVDTTRFFCRFFVCMLQSICCRLV